MKKVKIFSLINALSTPRKSGLLLNLFKGKSVEEALQALEFSDKKASKMWYKLIKSGVGFFNGVPESKIFVEEAYVGPGSLQKSYRFKSRGHISPIRKRKSNLYVKLGTEVSQKKPGVSRTSSKKLKKNSK